MKGAKTLLSANQPDGFDCPRLRLARPQPRARPSSSARTASRPSPPKRPRAAHGHRAVREHTVSRTGRAESDFWPREPGPPHRTPWSTTRASDTLHADRMGRRLRADRRAPERAARPEPGDLLHLGPRQQRGGLPLPAVRARVRHQQLPRLLEHVPRAQRQRPAVRQIGVGKGTVTLDDFEKADAIFIFGQNPGTNHPRMLGELRAASKRGCKHRQLQPAARARPGALRRPAGQARDGDAGVGTPISDALLPAARGRRHRRHRRR